jgi:hypothetical protein
MSPACALCTSSAGILNFDPGVNIWAVRLDLSMIVNTAATLHKLVIDRLITPVPIARVGVEQVTNWTRSARDRYSFLDDVEQGFHSETFDLTGNIVGEDYRGLDNVAKKEIRRIMRQNPELSFDEARRMYTSTRFAANDIRPDGRPNDPKAFFFS